MRKTRKRRSFGRDAAAAMGFLSPSFVGLFAFVVVPIIGAVVLSLFDWDILTAPKYIGFANYATIWDELVTGRTLRQVFANMLDNAIDALQPEGDGTLL